MNEIIAAPTLCDHIEIELAHTQMQRHRACRTDRCAWRAAAYQTLVLSGRLSPPSTSPRERAAARGLSFPALEAESATADTPPAESLRKVLDKLTQPSSSVSGTEA